MLIGGGDGTFGWVLSSITDIQPHLACDNPPCALLPLGTGKTLSVSSSPLVPSWLAILLPPPHSIPLSFQGNDLARALKWGPGYTDEKVMDLLNGVKGAETVGFDR